MTADLAIRDEAHYLSTVHDVRVLAERIERIEDAKDLADRAAAAKVWAERARLGQEQVNLAAIARLWAERRAGELLTQTPRRTGGDAMRALSSPTTEAPPSLPDLGITRDQSSRWQRLAQIPADEFQAAVEQASEQGTVTTAAVTRIAEGNFEQRVRDEFFAKTPVFDAFWKACGLLIKQARPDGAAAEEWDGEIRRKVRQWAPLMVERINELAALCDEGGLRVISGGTNGSQ